MTIINNNLPELFRLYSIQKASFEAQEKIKNALIEAMKMWDDYEEFYNLTGEILEEMEDGIAKSFSLKEHQLRIEKMRKLYESKKGLFGRQ